MPPPTRPVGRRRHDGGRLTGCRPVLLLAAMLAIAAAPPVAAPPLDRVRLPDGRALALHCTGKGRPTVLLDAGWGADSRAWWRVQPLVAATNRVCSYDRAGMGASDPGPAPRDGAAIAADLDAALRAAHVAGPFVVVGHSAGGLYVRLFADRRPRDVVGMVLVDPSVEFQDRRLAALFGPGAGSLAGLRARTAACLAAAGTPPPGPVPARCDPALPAATLTTEVGELDSLWTATSDELAAGRQHYGALPLIVLTAGETNAGLPDAARRAADVGWAGLHDEIAARSTVGIRRTVAGSGHLMLKDRPDAVVAAIAEVAAASRRTPSRP